MLPSKKLLKFFKHCVFCFIFEKDIIQENLHCWQCSLIFLTSYLNSHPKQGENSQWVFWSTHKSGSCWQGGKRVFWTHWNSEHCLLEPWDCSQISLGKKLSEPTERFLTTITLYVLMRFNKFIYPLIVLGSVMDLYSVE